MKRSTRILAILLTMAMVLMSAPFSLPAMAMEEPAYEVESVVIEPLFYFENNDGYEGQDYITETGEYTPEYFQYFYTHKISYTVTLAGGTVLQSDSMGDVHYNESSYSIQLKQDYENQWEVGTQYVEATVMGYTTTVEVTVVGAAEITIDPIVVTEGVDGYYTNQHNEPNPDNDLPWWFRYDETTHYTITLTDGTVLESDEQGNVYYKDYSYSLYLYQEYDHQWEVGTHVEEGAIMGFPVTATVTVLPNPVTSVSVEPLTLIKNTNGYERVDYNPETGCDEWWYQYNDTAFSYTATLEDGTVISSKEGYFPFKEAPCNYVQSWQSVQDQWETGTQEVSLNVLGIDTTTTVTILEITDVEVEPIELVKEVNGIYEYDPEIDEAWFFYNDYICDFTVSLSNGDVLKSDHGYVAIGDSHYPVNLEQDYNHQWHLGTQTVNATLLGHTFTVDVTIVEPPFTSFTVEPITVVDKADAQVSWHYDEQTGENVPYYYYYICPQFSVTLRDGTVLESDEQGYVYFEGDQYSVALEQNINKQWQVGTQEISTSFLNLNGTTTVTVLENPVVSIQMPEQTVIEHMDGWWNEGYNWMEDRYTEYFHYSVPLTEFSFTLKDGTTVTEQYYDFNGKNYWFNCYDDQSASEPWGLGEHSISIEFMGHSIEVPVTVIENPYVSLTIDSVDPVSEDDFYFHVDEYGNSTKYYELPAFTYTLTLSNGSTITKRSTEDDTKLSVTHEQGLYPWTVEGPNAFTVTYGNLTATAYATIEKAPPYHYFEQDGEIYINGITSEALIDGVLTIPSEINGKPVVGITGMNFSEDIQEIILPDSVTVLGENAFSYLENLTTVTVGTGLTNLTYDMLLGCSNLTAVNVAEENPHICSVNGVVYDKAMTTLLFYPQAGSREYTVPATVSNIDALSYGVYSDIVITFDENSEVFTTVDGVTYTADMTRVVYCDPNKAGAYVMPDTVTEIAPGAFKSCTELTNVTLSSKVTTIAYATFADCTALKTMVLPQALTSIDPYALANTSSLEGIELPETLEFIGEGAFRRSGLPAVTIPDSTVAIDYAAFCESGVATLNLGNGLKAIESKAFYGTPIKELVLPDSLEYMGPMVFSNCDSLESVTLNTTLESISYGAFAGCQALSAIVIPENILYIEETAFSECVNLTDVDIKNPEVYIGYGAFWNCGLTELDLSNITQMDDLAFAGNKMTQIVFPNSVTRVAYGSFMNCTELKSIDLPDSLESMGAHAFDNTAWYNKQQDGPVYLENALYDYKGSAKENPVLKVKEGTTVIADYAFENTDLEYVFLPSTLKTLGFVYMDELVVPEGVTHIENLGCNSMILPATLESIQYPYDIYCDHILFTGTPEQWEELTRDTYIPEYCTVHFGTPVEGETVNLSCTTDGYTTVGCPECDKTYYTDYTFAPGHKFTEPVVVEPTCKETGIQRGVCLACKKENVVELPKLAHNFVNGECTECNQPNIQSDHNYAENTEQRWTYTKPGATQIAVTFSKETYFEDGCDFLILYDANEEEVGWYSGNELAGQTVVVEGDTIVFELRSDFSENFYGFAVTDIKATYKLATETETETEVVLEAEPGVIEEETVLVAENTDLRQEAQIPTGFSTEKAVTYDIRLEKEGEAVQPNGKVEVILPVPAEMNGADCHVFYVDDNGNMTNMNAIFKNGKLHFNTTHFSEYVVLEAVQDVTFTTADATLLCRYLLGYRDAAIDTALMDLNHDGKLGIADAIFMLRAISEQ